MKELVSRSAVRPKSPDNQLQLTPFSEQHISKVREAAFRTLGFEGSNNLRKKKADPDFWEKDQADRARVFFAATMMNNLLPYDDAEKFREDWERWERSYQERARIIFAATMIFINLSLKTRHWETNTFFETIKELSKDNEKQEDGILKPQIASNEIPESDKTLELKLKKAQKLNDEDPTQIVFWENEGLKSLPKRIQDYLKFYAVTIIRFSTIPDYETLLRKNGLVVEVKRDWQKSIDSNTKELSFIGETQKRTRRGAIQVFTKESLQELTFDQRQAFVSPHEPSVYVKRFSYSAAIDHWNKKFEERIAEKGQDIEQAKGEYSTAHYNAVFAKRTREEGFSPTLINALLKEDTISPHELHEQACIALHGQGSEKYRVERYVLGLKALERAFWMTGDPLFALASKLENKRLRDKQRVEREQKKANEKSFQAIGLKHHQGEEEFQSEYYFAKVQYWMGMFLDIVGNEGLVLYREFGDRHTQNIESLGLNGEGQTRSKKFRKKTAAYYRHILDNYEQYNSSVLYSHAINAIRNPFKKEKHSSELAGNELFERAIEIAGMNSLAPSDCKAYYIRAYIEELVRKWVMNKDKRETKPLIESKVYTMLRTVMMSRTRTEKPKPHTSITSYDIDEIPR